MKVIDLFSGVGGLSLGFEMAGFTPVVAIEKDSEIAQAYKNNNDETEVIAGDIRDIDADKIFSKYRGDVSVVIGGPPCQGFSQKGKRLSFDDERNYLFNYFVNVVETVSPKFFVLENVSTIVTTENGFFRDKIIEEFARHGYDVCVKVLNASDYGVPQLRSRAFFVGQKKHLDFKFPKPLNKIVTIKDSIYDLPFINSGDGDEFYQYRVSPQNDYQKLMRRNSKIVMNHYATNHSPVALERLALIPKGKGKEVLPNHHRTKSIYSGTWCRMLEDEVSVTITTRFDTPSSGRFTHPILDRCITVREAARLQSFPDDFIFSGTKTSQMKQVGNAVPPLLAKAIAINIKKYL